MPIPESLRINAWDGERESAPSTGSSSLASWGLRGERKHVARLLKPPERPNFAEWADPRVGWGLVLPHVDGLSEATLATADDAPEPIRELWARRGKGPVFRYRADWPYRFSHLTNYGAADGAGADVPLDRAEPGVASGEIPHYLLLYGPPSKLPWELQYVLNASRCVGRLHLEGEALERYVSALLGGWAGASAATNGALVWAVDHGEDDITRLMRDAIAAKVAAKYAADPDISSAFLDGGAGEATRERLATALAERRPGVIVTTSHGQTGPLADVAAMRASLGLPVDGAYHAVDPDALLASWRPGGAIWYAHACCSAGSDARTIYDGALEPGSSAREVLEGVAKVGAEVAPLPTRLLGASEPLRAFVGHVEPTFDWTIRDPAAGQDLTGPLVTALYDFLFAAKPVGLALAETFRHLAGLSAQIDAAAAASNRGEPVLDSLLALRLAACDVKSTVILGDPTAALPPL